ncbi:MAG TPA: MerR family transcriptional regulator, partial [candidate division WWE3 bacterium]|nr:MerR family transcriptional regulator [candidate division WWE3 bacterium]
MEKLLPIGKAAQYLGISTKTLRRWENQGRISPSRTQGNQRRYSLSDLEDLKALKEGSRLPISTEKPILSASEAAKKLGVSSRTMRRWEKEGDLPQALRTSGGHRRYSPRELKRFQIEAKARNHASQTPTAKPKYPPPGQPPYIPIRSAEEFRPRPKLAVRYLLLATLVLITLASVVWANLPNLTKERVKRALIPGVENPIVDVNDALEYQGAGAFITGLKAKLPLETSSLVTEVLRVTNDAILNTSRFLGTVFFGSDSSYFISPTGDAVFNSVTSSKVDAEILSSITIEVDKLNVEDLVVSGTSTGVTGTGGGGGIATG